MTLIKGHHWLPVTLSRGYFVTSPGLSAMLRALPPGSILRAEPPGSPLTSLTTPLSYAFSSAVSIPQRQCLARGRHCESYNFLLLFPHLIFKYTPGQSHSCPRLLQQSFSWISKLTPSLQALLLNCLWISIQTSYKHLSHCIPNCRLHNPHTLQHPAPHSSIFAPVPPHLLPAGQTESLRSLLL